MTSFVLLITSMLAVLVTAPIVPALPALAEHFSSQTPHMMFWSKLALTAPALSFALLSPISGELGDRISKKKLLIGSALLYGVSGLAPLILTGIKVIFATRILLGVAAAGTMTSVTALFSELFPEEEKKRLLKAQAAVLALSDVIFLNIGSFLSTISWQAPFALYSVALLLLILHIRYLPTAATAAKQCSHSQTKQGITTPSPQTPLWIIFSFLTGLSLLVALCYLIPTQLPFLLQERFGIAPQTTGIIISIVNIAGFSSCLLCRKFFSHWSPSQLFRTVIFLIGAGYLIIGLSASLAQLILGLCVAGLGIGLNIPTATMWILNKTDPAKKGRYIGLMLFFYYLGEFISPVLFQGIIARGVQMIPPTFLVAGIMLSITSTILAIKKERAIKQAATTKIYPLTQKVAEQNPEQEYNHHSA
ncbi:MAG: MFS transporter [Chlamydiota bacterium]